MILVNIYQKQNKQFGRFFRNKKKTGFRYILSTYTSMVTRFVICMRKFTTSFGYSKLNK